MVSPFFGEFMGTLMLILLGDGVVANVLLKKSKAEGAGWMVITSGWCFAVMAGIFTAIACGSKDAFLNPAVTMGFAVSTGDYHRLAPYFAAETLGYLVSCLVRGVGLSLGGTTGYAINPARDLGPRIAHALLPIAGKGDSDWGYASVPVIGPFIGGGLAGLLIHLLGF